MYITRIKPTPTLRDAPILDPLQNTNTWMIVCPWHTILQHAACVASHD